MSNSSEGSGVYDEARSVDTWFLSYLAMSQRTDESNNTIDPQIHVAEDESPEQRVRRERNKIAQRKRRSRQKNELLVLKLENAAFASRETILRNQHYRLSQKNLKAVEENERLQRLVTTMTEQLNDAKNTNTIHQNQLKVWKDAYYELLQRSGPMAPPTSAKRSAEEAELNDVQQRRPHYNSYFR